MGRKFSIQAKDFFLLEKEFVEDENKYVHFVSSIHEFWVFCLATTNILQTGAVTTHGQRERERERER